MTDDYVFRELVKISAQIAEELWVGADEEDDPQTLNTKRRWYEHLWMTLSSRSGGKLPTFDRIYYFEENNAIESDHCRFVKHLVTDCRLFIIHPNIRTNSDGLSLHEAIKLYRSFRESSKYYFEPSYTFTARWLVTVIRELDLEQIQHAVIVSPDKADRRFLERLLAATLPELMFSGKDHDLLGQLVNIIRDKNVLRLLPPYALGKDMDHLLHNDTGADSRR